jgi:hypothetical protein
MEVFMIVYKITNSINNKAYIGITSGTLKDRMKAHKNHSGNKRRKLYDAFRKYGFENFQAEIIEEIATKKEAIEKETFYIKHFDTFSNGYNMNEGGTGLVYHTEETKKKISENNYWLGKSRSDEDNPMFRKTHTNEAKRKISESNKGNKHRIGKLHTEETKKLISEKAKGRASPIKGKKRSDEFRKKVSEGKKGKTPKLKFVYEITTPTGEIIIINNMKKFCEENNISRGNMSSVLSGKYEHTKGFKAKKL